MVGLGEGVCSGGSNGGGLGAAARNSMVAICSEAGPVASREEVTANEVFSVRALNQ
jgi:hypothetical protein